MKADKLKTARAKIKPLKEIIALTARAKRAGKKVVTTNGCFDIIHIGHVRSLEVAKSLGDLLVVGINSDSSVGLNKGPSRPINPQAQRAEVVAGFAAVDFVFIFNSKTPIEWVKKVKPSIHAKGNDRKMSEIAEKEAVEINGGVVRLLPHTKGQSTKSLIKRIAPP